MCKGVVVVGGMVVMARVTTRRLLDNASTPTGDGGEGERVSHVQVQV